VAIWWVFDYIYVSHIIYHGINQGMPMFMFWSNVWFGQGIGNIKVQYVSHAALRLYKNLKTDNGPPFQGSEFKNFANNLSINHRKITPPWPRANGWSQKVYEDSRESRENCKCGKLELEAAVVHISSKL
jgi:hypothetical protein